MKRCMRSAHATEVAGLDVASAVDELDSVVASEVPAVCSESMDTLESQAVSASHTKARAARHAFLQQVPSSMHISPWWCVDVDFERIKGWHCLTKEKHLGMLLALLQAKIVLAAESKA
eukprot:5499200-Amphidinium_carterae.1